MISLFPIMAILGTTLFMMALGTVWYSDLWAGPKYRRIITLSEAQKSEQGMLLIPHLVLSAIGYATTLTFVSLAMLYLAKSGITVWYAPVAAASVVVTAHLHAVLWEGRPWSHFIIVAGFNVCVVLGGSAMIWYWPW